MLSPLVSIAIIIVFPSLLIIILYNRIIGKRNEIENAMGGIDTYLKKRYDLVPNLITSVKQYMEHEKSILTEITKLRSKAIDSKESDDVVNLNNKMTKSLGKLMVAVENYPDLKANQNFLQLQNTLNEIEDNIAASRRFFNSAVTDFNTSIEIFPSNILAGIMNLKRRHVFEIDKREKKNINLQELF